MPSFEGLIPIDDTVVIQPFSSVTLGFIPARLHLQVEGAAVRYLYLGGTPTSSSGFSLSDGSNGFFQDTSIIEGMRLIAVSGSGTLRVAVVS